MPVLRKLVAYLVYAAVLLPCSGPDLRVTAWVRAIEMTSTALDKTLRRKKSEIENDRLSQHARMMHLADGDRQDVTGRIRNGQFAG